MVTKTQAQLERRAEVLITNGQQPVAQAIIAGVGYGPAALDAGGALLAAVRQGRARKQELLTRSRPPGLRRRRAGRPTGN